MAWIQQVFKGRMVSNAKTSNGYTKTINSQTITVIEEDASGDVLRSTATVVPTDAGSGYAKGALHIDTDVASGTTGLYVNVGTNTSCLFKAVSNAA